MKDIFQGQKLLMGLNGIVREKKTGIQFQSFNVLHNPLFHDTLQESFHIGFDLMIVTCHLTTFHHQSYFTW